MKRKLTIEHKLKISIAHKGKKQKDETKNKIRKKLLGRHISPNTQFKKGNEIGKDTRFKVGNEIGKDTRFKKGKNNPNWKGGYRSHHTYRKEIEKNLGKKLQKNETIHHKDGDYMNNSKENIIIFKNHSEHMRYHWQVQKEKKLNGRMKKTK